ncbi:GNAT family N-acetyltransferase [Yinghuangia seranimata]|uniref:GNAT family N-acetyltransferase n=1 Tax=Yinghuangia seranimata TaxID=408067 RepID=UPI00248D01A4|nr:GNAT family N-acetyltransferase [Yinghuangia seranimata]MDI2130621.1 GNAT family N-acetyltransferase [Yinghuangia seranimata]
MTNARPAPEGLTFRHPVEDDYPRIQHGLTHWWGGLGGEAGAQQRRLLVPRLFLQHFTGTSWIAEDPDDTDGWLVAFLVGFLSQDHPDEAYIHFVGVDPERKRGGVGAALYERFFAGAREAGRTRVKCITGPANRDSIAYHTRMGFTIEKGDTEVDGVPVKSDYDGEGLPRVCFVRELAP